MAWRLAAPRRVAYATQMLAAVAHAHARRIIHCDLKPENFILFPGDRAASRGFRHLARSRGARCSARARAPSATWRPSRRWGACRCAPTCSASGSILWQLFGGRRSRSGRSAGPCRASRGCAARPTPTSSPSCAAPSSSIPHKRFGDAQQMAAAFERLRGRSQVLRASRPTKRRVRRAKAPPDWGRLRQQQFLRVYGTAAPAPRGVRALQGPDRRVDAGLPLVRPRPRPLARRDPARGALQRAAAAAGSPTGATARGATARPSGGSPRATTPTGATPNGVQTAPASAALLMPWARYCPWCRRRPRQRWKLPGRECRCARCGWGVHADFWAFCPWCGKERRQGAVRRS